MALIFTLSSIPNLSPPVNVGNADKIAHFLEYGGLGFLLARAWRGTRWREQLRTVLLLTVLSGISVSLLDELYQGQVGGREQSLADLGADLAGLLTAGALVMGAARRRAEATGAR
jgi:VanZ family protein